MTDNPAEQPGQSDSNPAVENGGVLGRTFMGVDANAERFRSFPDAPTAFGSTAGANLPLSDNFDYSVNYGFEYGKSKALRLIDNTLGNDVTTYLRFKYFSPFATAGFGYALDRDTVPLLPSRFDHMFFDVGAGLEFPLTKAASLRATLGDEESIRRPHEKDWDYDFSANYWLGSVVGTYVGAVVKDGHGGALDAIEYTAGLRFSFD